MSQLTKWRVVAVALPALILAGCSTGGDRTPTAPIATPPPPPLVQPTPPAGAAPNLVIPARLEDGSYATVNRYVTQEGAAWHLRAALNVASLNCPDTAIAPAYNRLLTTHKVELNKAHQAVSKTHGKELDSVMTRVYNYWAQPPVLDAFCARASQLAQLALTWPKGSYIAAAGPALTQLDEPYHAFYARYDAYRTELNTWRAATMAAGNQTAQIKSDGQ